MYSIISGDKAGGENCIMTRLGAIKDDDIVVLASEKGETNDVRFDIFACSYSGGTYHGEKTGSHEEPDGYYDENVYKYDSLSKEDILVHKKGDPKYKTVIDYKEYPYGNITTNKTSFFNDEGFIAGNNNNRTYSFSFFKNKLGLNIQKGTNLSSLFLTFYAKKDRNFWTTEPRRSLSIFPFGESDNPKKSSEVIDKITEIFN